VDMAGGDSEVDRGSSFVRNRSHNEYDTGSAATDNLQNTDQTDPIASTNSSGEGHLSIARFSEQTLALIAVCQELVTWTCCWWRCSREGVAWRCLEVPTLPISACWYLLPPTSESSAASMKAGNSALRPREDHG